MSNLRPFVLVSLLSGLAGLAACGGSDVVLPNEGEPAHLAIADGNGQNGVAGKQLANPLVVVVTDSKDRPVADVPVAFTVTAGGGTVDQAQVPTDVNGKAQVLWTLGTSAGAQTVEAKIPNTRVTGLVVQFGATAGAGNAAVLQAVKGDKQSGTAGSALTDSLVVKAVDGSGNGVRGVTVAWTVTGGGAVSAAQTTTGADGTTGIIRTLGPAAGAQTTVATAAGVTAPVTFTQTAQVGAAGDLQIVTQPSAAAQSGQPFAQQPKLRLLDKNGNPVATSGVAVTAMLASAPPGSSLIGNATVATVGGIATFSGLGISGPAGSYTLNFSGQDLTGVSSSPPTVIGSGSATKLGMKQQPSSSAQSGVPFAQQPSVQVQDASGNPVAQSGVDVNVFISSGGGTLSGTTTATTNGSGVATFTNLAITGTPGNRTLTFAASGLTSATSSAIGVGLGSSSTSITSITPGTSEIGQAYTVSVQVSGTGAQPTGKVTVSDGAETCDATLNGSGAGSCSLTSTTAGTKTITAVYGGDSQHGGSSATPQSHTVTLIGTTTAIGTITPEPSLIGQAYTVPVSVSSSSGAPSGSASVSDGSGATCTATITNGAGSCQLTSGTEGTKTITASFAAAGNFAGSSATKSHQVDKASTTTTVSVDQPDAPPGTTVTATATVASNSGAGTPTGTVTFKYPDQTVICANIALNPGGTASCQFPASATGTVTAEYSGNPVYQSSSGTTPLTVSLTNTTTKITNDSPDPSTVGAAYLVAFTVTASHGGPPGGKVTVSDGAGGSCEGTLASGAGNCSLTSTVAGPKTLTASYPGTATFASSSGTAPHDVTAANQPPTARNDAYTVNEDSTLTVAAPGVLANDSDPEHQPLGAELVTPPAHAASFSLAADGGFTYVPAANYNGADSFTYRASDGTLASAAATVAITVNPVNDAPSFTKGADQTASAAAGPQTVSGWATAISPGPPDESGQTVNFLVTTDDAAAFTTPPAVAADGTLTYTPAPGAAPAVVTVTVAAQDDGGTANGGQDTSAPQTFTITITP